MFTVRVLVLFVVLIFCFDKLSAIGLYDQRWKPDTRFIQVTSSVSFPDMGWQYGLRYYVLWRKAELHYGTIHFQWGGETARYTVYKPPSGLDIGAQVVQPLNELQPYGLNFSVRWHSFQFRTYNSLSHYARIEKIRGSISLSVGYTHELSDDGRDRLSSALWVQIPALKFANGWLKGRFMANVFMQYNHPLNAELPEYVFPVQCGLEFGYRFLVWRID